MTLLLKICVGLLLLQTAWGDEPYTFYRIDCVPEIGLFAMDSVSAYNVGSFVWQDREQMHHSNIMLLQEKYGIYAFDAYGSTYADEPHYECELNDYKVDIAYQKYAPDSSKPNRMAKAATVIVRDAHHKVLKEISLEHVREKVYLENEISRLSYCWGIPRSKYECMTCSLASETCSSGSAFYETNP